MTDKHGIKASFTAVAFVSVFGVYAYANDIAAYSNDIINPPETGKNYLVSQGYKAVSGGIEAPINSCASGDFARAFDATKDGFRYTSIKVCYKPFEGSYKPAL